MTDEAVPATQTARPTKLNFVRRSLEHCVTSRDGHLRDRMWLLVLVLSTFPARADESWSCFTRLENKQPFAVQLRLHGNKLYATPGNDVFTVISDTPRHVLAYFLHWNESLKPRVPVFLYNWIDRQTGEFLTWDDIGIAPIYENAIPEVSLSSGTCKRQ